jgi:hypothetical protein
MDANEPSQEKKSLGFHSKRPFSNEEDIKLVEMVAIHGNHWTTIVQFFDDRTPKSIRERYIYFITQRKFKFTDEDKRAIFDMVNKEGHIFSQISKRFPRSTKNEIKNVYNTMKKKIITINNVSDQHINSLLSDIHWNENLNEIFNDYLDFDNYSDDSFAWNDD